MYGVVQKDWSASGPNDLDDLVAMENGGICVGFSSAQLGHPRNILGKLKALLFLVLNTKSKLYSQHRINVNHSPM